MRPSRGEELQTGANFSPEKRTDAARAGKRTGPDGERAGDTAGGDRAPAGGANLCGELPPGQHRVREKFQVRRAPGNYDPWEVPRRLYRSVRGEN